MTSVMLRTPPQMTIQDQWKSLFTDFTTVTGSCSFVKKIMAVSFSAITFMRGIFPERAYGERFLGGLKLKILTESSKIPEVNKFINLVRSCYEAVDKKYLQQISIGVCLDAENRDEVLEAYSLNICYNDNECSISNQSGPVKITEDDPTVKGTYWLLKSILQISDVLSPLPKNAYLTMKLLYNDEITPKDYEPAGFEPTDNEKFSFSTSAVKFKLGDIATDFHACKVYIKSVLSKEPLSQLIEQPTLTDSQISRENVKDEAHAEDDYVLETEIGLKQGDSQANSAKEIPPKIQCPCNCKQDSESSLLTSVLQCGICEGQHHSVCYGFLDTDLNESEFYCIQCINEAPSKAIGEDLIYVYQGKEQQELCGLRRALVFCSSIKQLSVNQLEKGLGCNKQFAKDLIERLEMEEFIRKCGSRYIVNEKKLKSDGYQEYFPRSDNKENTGLLKMKYKKPTTISQEMDADEIEIMSNEREEEEGHKMDFDIDNEVEKLNIRGSSGKKPKRASKRKIAKYKIVKSNNSEEMFLPAKRRCLATHEMITLPE